MILKSSGREVTPKQQMFIIEDMMLQFLAENTDSFDDVFATAYADLITGEYDFGEVNPDSLANISARESDEILNVIGSYVKASCMAMRTEWHGQKIILAVVLE